MLEFQEDLYALLGVDDGASVEEIRKAYLKLAKKLHPDRFPNDSDKRAAAQAEFSRVTRAHDVLSDTKQREEYDAIRTLAKNRNALDMAEPETPSTTVTPATPSNAVEKGQSAESGHTTKETWARKHAERATELLKKRRYPEAETALKEAIRLTPKNASYYAYLAEVQLARGWKTLAASSIQTALTIDPKNHEAKQIELKLKATSLSGKAGSSNKKGILDQLKELLNKKM